jgi:hypothetical protein
VTVLLHELASCQCDMGTCAGQLRAGPQLRSATPAEGRHSWRPGPLRRAARPFGACCGPDGLGAAGQELVEWVFRRIRRREYRRAVGTHYRPTRRNQAGYSPRRRRDLQSWHYDMFASKGSRTPEVRSSCVSDGTAGTPELLPQIPRQASTLSVATAGRQQPVGVWTSPPPPEPARLA